MSSRRPVFRDAAAAATLALLLLTGCADDTAPGGTPADATTGAAPTDDATATDTAEGSAEEDATSDAAVYDFTATTLDGEAFDGADLAGSPTVLWFWAPWCPTCRAQIPTVSGIGAEHGDDVQVVAVGGLDSAEAIGDLATSITDVTHLVDDAGEVWQHFGVTAQSTFVVLDADGAVVAEGSLSDDEVTDLAADLAAQG